MSDQQTETATDTPAETPAPPRFTRRDMIEVAKLCGRVPFNHLFTEDGPSAEAVLGMQYISEKRAGTITVGFGEWLDEDLGVELVESNGDGDAGEGADPT